MCCFYAESRFITIEFLQHLLKTNIMKKVFSIIALGTMTLSLSSFTHSRSLEFRDCAAEAWNAGTDAQNLGFDEGTVYDVTDFVYDACINGRDYSLLMLAR
ncbi:hypothetical protein GCM10009433_01600 [Psychroflexus lacisalsi]|uniref:Uncharacterized protein n=2 Tax=Psychroflexus lacisalsi TaxID=503928 RepID=A0ABN1K0R9_9FLAO